MTGALVYVMTTVGDSSMMDSDNASHPRSKREQTERQRNHHRFAVSMKGVGDYGDGGTYQRPETADLRYGERGRRRHFLKTLLAEAVCITVQGFNPFVLVNV